ncbi:MAG: AmmeMemoRadiSam system protein B, partial [Thermoplasmata archaeon]|nr:AmmeMemoRadiSam system protein B [Thermoplasmata archaeon]
MTTELRAPAVAGTFYPSDPEELREALRDSFTGPRGPGRWPEVPGDAVRNIRAAVVPHAGYEFSGP